MNYWLADNRDQAEKNTLHRLIGYLQVMEEETLPVNAHDILAYIGRVAEEEEQRLNECFPDKARP